MEVPICEDNKKEKLSIKPRRIPNQNIVSRLWNRQTHIMKPGTFWNQSREYYKHIFPNFTIDKVDKPPFFLRKFSPDGKNFIVFSCDRTAVEVFDFQGCDAAENILTKSSRDLICPKTASSATEEHKNYAQNVRENAFSTFFKLRHQIPIASDGQYLNRECSLFTDDSRFVIVMSAIATHAQNQTQIPFDEARPNNESIDFNHKYRLEHFKLHIINIKTGLHTDSKSFRWDKIFPSHNQGLYLYQSTLAVLSVQHQLIHLFKITEEGRLVETYVIGRFCFDDDEMIYSQNAIPRNIRPFMEEPINSLKHRVLAHLFKEAKAKGPVHVRRFYQHFEFLRSLKMWKMQLLDSDHLFIKYASEDVVSSRVQSSDIGLQAQPSFFVVYNIPKAAVLAVYENTSQYLLAVYEQYSELLRPVTPDLPSPWQQGGSWQQQISAERNVYTRQAQQRVKDTIINAKHGGHTEAVKRILGQLPIPAQAHTHSPYLDLSLFNYDDKYISAFERPKGCAVHPIRFYERSSGILKFRIYAGLNGSNYSRRLVAFTFHPYQPFAISVQRTDADYSVNFHFRHVPKVDSDIK